MLGSQSVKFCVDNLGVMKTVPLRTAASPKPEILGTNSRSQNRLSFCRLVFGVIKTVLYE